MNRCETCKWWSGHVRARHGTCSVPTMFPPADGEMRIGVVEGYADVDLLTSPTFGCMLWEPGEGIERCGNCQGAYRVGVDRHVFFGLGACEIVREEQQ